MYFANFLWEDENNILHWSSVSSINYWFDLNVTRLADWHVLKWPRGALNVNKLLAGDKCAR